ncbi:MAG: hypothetical protein ABSF71_27290 [Terriglobia bacterium]
MSTAAASPGFMCKLKIACKLRRQHGLPVRKAIRMDIQGGQLLEMTLLDPSETDAEGNTRTLSIPMLPHEETLMEATRMRNTAFKRGLNTMPPGSAVKVEGPSGSQTPLIDIKRTAAYVAGGIGLTPFRSIAFRAAKEKLPHRI